MARYLLLALFLVFAVFLVQVNSAPSVDTTTANSLEEAFKSAGESINKAFNEAKPKLDEFLAKGQEFFDTVGKKISEEAGKIIPKNEEKPSA